MKQFRIILSIILILVSFSHLILVGQAIRIMPLGNSITYGNYHPELRPTGLITGYRQSLWLELQAIGYDIDFVGNVTAGQDALPTFDPHNQGHPGWRDDEIADSVYSWLQQNPPEIIILHIGTNGLNPDPSDVADILDEIDRFENNYGTHIKVVLAKIINRAMYGSLTTHFNYNIEKMALDRVEELGDDIIVIDMEFETGMIYGLTAVGGDMYDNLHPNVIGHAKMAERWYQALLDILPIQNQIPRIISRPNPYGNYLETYNYQVESTNSPVFRLLSHPTGMTIDTVSGLINWLSVNPDTFLVDIIAENTFSADTQSFKLIIKEATEQVRDGLIALYDFTESTGNIIHDVSGIGKPVNLYINNPNSIKWDSLQGLEVISDAILTTTNLAEKIVDSCKTTNEFSIEMWLRTGNKEQDGPSNIFTLSDPETNGVTISQKYESTDENKYYFNGTAQTSDTDTEGNPAFTVDERYGNIVLQHIVYSKDNEGNEKLFVDGIPVKTNTRTGNLSTWSNTYNLTLCNNFSFDKPWLGKLFLVAIYNKALSNEEVLQNYTTGYSNELLTENLPEKPDNINGNPLSSIAAKINWSDNSDNESGFIIERKKEGEIFKQIDMVPADTKDYTDVGLDQNTVYIYRIKAINNISESDCSNEISIKTFENSYLSNVAYLKSATQSSTIYDGFASNAVDGNTNGTFSLGSVTHTDYDMNAWWQVDLGSVYNISHIEIWNRTDQCCIDRLANFYVFVSEDPFPSNDLETILAQEDIWRTYQKDFPTPTTTKHVAQKGRYIRLQLAQAQEICLAELIVWGNTHLNPPTFTSSQESETNEDDLFNYTLTASDTDGDQLVYSIPQIPTWLSFNKETNILSGTPSNSDTGTHQYKAIVYDGLYNVEQYFLINVHNVNDSAIITSIPSTETNEDQYYSYTLTAIDIDSDSLIYSADLIPEWLSFNSSTGLLSGIPTNSDTGYHSIELSVFDGYIKINQTFSLHVNNINDVPILNGLLNPITINEDSLFILKINDLNWEDIDNSEGEVNLIIIEGENYSFSGNTVYPSPDYYGIVNLNLKIFDLHDTSETQIIEITISPIKDKPVITSIPPTHADDYENYEYIFTTYDPDNDLVNLSAIQLPGWLNFDTETGILSGFPAWNHANQTFEVTLRANDGIFNVDQTWGIKVANNNDAPVWITIPDTFISVGEEYYYQFLASDIDEDDSLNYSVITKPSWLFLSSTGSNNSLSGTPAVNDIGIHDVNILVNDGIENVTQEWQIAVARTNDYTDYSIIDKYIYPNPANEFITINMAFFKKLKISIYDIYGRLIKDLNLESTCREIYIGDLNEGLYNYIIKSDNENLFGRLIILR